MGCNTASEAGKRLAKERWKGGHTIKKKSNADKIQAILKAYPYDYELEEYIEAKRKVTNSPESKNKLKRLEAKLYADKKLKKPYQQLKRLITKG